MDAHAKLSEMSDGAEVPGVTQGLVPASKCLSARLCLPSGICFAIDIDIDNVKTNPMEKHRLL